ncbi:cuticle protein 16.5 [Scaptodrosophila lebanonensis]|uniref:Cuticle protein 16.5 n=1 Tax=Drosophila lebanonensis TaxID=7225 RepID=A0A6J2TRK9_DROLE|nr:cuticle protein 16.5 [Scaptodrosophila lebanonensis]
MSCQATLRDLSAPAITPTTPPTTTALHRKFHLRSEFSQLIFCLAALVACVHARPGGPAAYSISAPSVDHASVGNTQEHTVKGHYGQSSQSDYTSQVQTAHSQSHVQRSSISNDAGLAPAIGGEYCARAAHAVAAPAVGYAHTAPALATHGLSYAAAPALATHGISYAAPALSHGISYAAPAYSQGYATAAAHAAPAYSYGGYAATAPALQLSSAHLGYAAAPALAHGYHLATAAAPTLKYAAAPAYAPGIIGHGIGLASPIAHIGAPLLKAAVAAPALVHTSVAGHGIQYGY